MLECSDIHAGYGRVPVLRGVNVVVHTGHFVSLIGPNGAGKSTVLKAITGYARLQSGTVTLAGTPITGLRADAFAHVYDLFPRLAERRTQLAGTMSGGEQQMVAIARGLMIRPRIMLLDEPSLGLAPRFVQIVFETLRMLKAEGLSMLVVEQNAAQALAIADHAYLLELGRNRLEGTGTELLENPETRRLYLGD
ncbi:MAG: ABC transporter ATP-binding protein [Proteobacteria bacterium]|nr:ABC transporter ATP-binding protein [Pseudomonadota bacterium]